MNDPLDAFDPEPSNPNQIVNGQSSRLEQQLRAVKPRAPQLDWNVLASSESSPTSSVTPLESIVQQSQSASSVSHDASRRWLMALAASWLLGAIVGGGTIYYAMATGANTTSGTTALVTQGPPNDSSQLPTSKLETQVTPPSNSPSIADVKEPQSGSASALVFGVASDLTDAFFEPWILDEPLSVGSLTSSRPSSARFTSMRSRPSNLKPAVVETTEGASKLTLETQADSSQRDPDLVNPGHEPATNSDSISSQRQLRHKYLKEAMDQIY